ncbi:MAG: hypothetical protein CMP83_03460 [Gammaproteobacteria bacterium]|nr:hypothetical protein [Gammaproteobacteria bacterium]
MTKAKVILSWLAIGAAGLINGVLEDIMFFSVLVPAMPMSIDLTGDIFWYVTVPMAQLLALAVTGVFAWFFLGLAQISRLVTFWLCWVLARVTFLLQVHNPVEDVAIYVLWTTIWCVLIGVLAKVKGSAAGKFDDKG